MRRPGIWCANGTPTNAAKMLSWRPGALTCIYDYLQPNLVAQYMKWEPDATVIVRIQHPKNWWENVSVSARNLAAEVVSKWPDLQALTPQPPLPEGEGGVYVYFCNEMNLHYENGDPNPGNQHLYESREWYEALGRWIREVADGIKQQVPEMRLVCPPFAYGHHEDGAPDDDGRIREEWAGYDWLADTIQSHFDGVICGHYYWGDSRGCIPARLYDPVEASWHAFRWRRVLKMFDTRYGISARMLIDEAGNMQASDPGFTDQAVYYAGECLRDERILALTYFLWQDPTGCEGNVINAWVPQIGDLDGHLERLMAMGDILPDTDMDMIRVLVDGDVLTMPVEQYLYGVVPAEIYPSWDIDALMAQAVLARSYARWRMANPRDSGFDIYGDARDQVYNPGLLDPRTDMAVDATEGVWLVDDQGQPFCAQYVSRCGRDDCPECAGSGGYDEQTWEGRACQYGMQFMATGGDDWRSITVAYYEDVRLNDEDPEEPEDPTDPVDPGEGDGMKIYDVLGREQDEAWLAANWGVLVDTSLRRDDGEGNFEIVSLREVEGPSQYQIYVERDDGGPYSGITVGRYWPDAQNSWPGGVVPENVVCPPEAIAHAIFGFTDAKGFCPFDCGTGDYAGPGDGVNTFWLPLHYGGSDVIRKMGMLPNTNHRTISPTFKWVPKGSDPEDPEDPEDPGENPGCGALIAAVVRLIDRL